MAQLRGIVNYVLAAVLALLLVWGFSPVSAGIRAALPSLFYCFPFQGSFMAGVSMVG